MRWKGHQPTQKTLMNAQHRYYLDVKRWLATPEPRDEEEDIRLSVESQRLDAMAAWVYHGRVIDRRWFIEEKVKTAKGTPLPSSDQLTLA